MNPTYQVNQVVESQPDADDSTVPISNLRHPFLRAYSTQNASWKLGMLTVDKQSDKSRFYTNLRREALWRANQAVLSRHGRAEMTKALSDKVWEIASNVLMNCANI